MADAEGGKRKRRSQKNKTKKEKLIQASEPVSGWFSDPRMTPIALIRTVSKKRRHMTCLSRHPRVETGGLWA